MKPTDIAGYRKHATGGQSPVTYEDEHGDKWFKYAVEYKDFDGHVFFVEIWATDFNDAIDRVTCIGETGNVLGCVQQEGEQG